MLVTLLLLLVNGTALALLWFGLHRPRAFAMIASGYGLAVLALAAFHTGLFSGATAASALPEPSSLPSISNARCREIVNLLVENRIILRPPGGDRLLVARAAWQQLPEGVRDQVLSCAEQLTPERATGRPIEVVEQ